MMTPKNEERERERERAAISVKDARENEKRKNRTLRGCTSKAQQRLARNLIRFSTFINRQQTNLKCLSAYKVQSIV